MQKCFVIDNLSKPHSAILPAVWLWLTGVDMLGPVQPLLNVKIVFRNGR